MIFDVVIVILLLGAIYLGYRYGTSIELLRLAKVFVGISLSSSYGSDFGVYLTKLGILKANDWAVLTLTGFLFLFAIYWTLVNLLEKLIIKMELEKSALNRYFGAFSNAIQALLLLTFIAFMSTQLSFVKDGYKRYLVENSFLYIKMDRICRKVVTGEFVAALQDDITGTSAKEVLIKTFSDKKLVDDILKEK